MKKVNKLTRFLSVLLSLMIVATMLPMSVFAETAENESTTVTVDGTDGANEWYDANATTLYINNKADLLAFAATAKAGTTFENVTVKLMADIDLNWAEWYPINFYGTFEGGNYTIKNLTYIPRSDGRMGFFQLLQGTANNLTLDGIVGTMPNGGQFGGFARYQNGNVNNVRVKNITLTIGSNCNWLIGGFFGYTNWGNATDCSVENFVINAPETLSADGPCIGGFIGSLRANSTYTNCDVKGFKINVNSTTSLGIGGFTPHTQTGWQHSKFIDCDVSGIDFTVSGTADVAGFITWPGSHTTATNCTTEGKIDVTGITTGDYVGGFYGNCGWNADLGQKGHLLTNCSADVDIITKSVRAGGFIGSATVNGNGSKYFECFNCSASGDITCVEGGTVDIGGFAGDGDRGVYNVCTASGTVTNNGSGQAGQFIGALYDVTPKYDYRYPAGTRDYLVDEISVTACYYTGDSELAFIGNTADGVDVQVYNPNAKVERVAPSTLAAGGYNVWPSGSTSVDRPLNIQVKFTALDTLDECLAGGLSDWLVDFNVKLNGLENDSIVANNCYLAGNYGDYGWYVIPLDGTTVEEGVDYPIVANYDATLNYKDICNSVKNFTAAIYIDQAILEANPDLEVELSLKMTDPDDANNVIVIGEPLKYSFDVELDGVKYATIKDALWTLSSADTTVHKLKLLNDIDLDVNYSTYNYPILINGFNVELDLNGKTITADWSKYTGSRKDNALIGVCNGGKLTVIDSVGGGKIVNNDDKADVENRIFWIMTSTKDKSIEVVIKGGTFIQNDTNVALLYVQGNKPSDNLAPMYVTIEGGHFETVNDDFFNAYNGFEHTSIITGGTFNKNPNDWEIKIHEDFKAVKNSDGTYGVYELPKAEVTVLDPITLTPDADDYMVWPSGDDTVDRPLDIVMNFKALETLEEAKTGGFGKWKTDFYLTITGLETSTILGDGSYLAGNYGEYGWIVIPTDGMTIENGVTYPIVSAYDKNLTYENICDYVKDFTAAIYINRDVILSNPNITVELVLKLTNPDDVNDTIIIGDPAVYTYDDILAVAINEDTGKKYLDLNTALTEATNKNETVALLKDIDLTSAMNLMIPAGVTLDLNGKSIITGSTFMMLGAFGDIIDTTEGEGGLVIAKTGVITVLSGTDNYMPLYDSAAGCYRFFSYDVVTKGSKAYGDNGLKSGYLLKFGSKLAYELLANDAANSGIELKVALTVDKGDGKPSTINYTCNADVLKGYAEKWLTDYDKYAANNKLAITFTVYGLAKLPSGTTISSVPTLTSTLTTVTKSGASTSYTKP